MRGQSCNKDVLKPTRVERSLTFAVDMVPPSIPQVKCERCFLSLISMKDKVRFCRKTESYL